ncbi:MAG: TIM barrel protein [Pseudomonadota bacterium]|nr:TIM barrel protein [Pseudomonadota bacterium]
MIQRALNQKTCAELSFEAFLQVAKEAGCIGVEPRNDLGRPFFDGIAPAEAAAMAQRYGLRLYGLSEVYGFNVWDDERAAQIAALLETAEASGAETISLIPCVDDRQVTPLVDVLRELVPIFKGRSVVPLIEPIGFVSSSIRCKAPLVQAIDMVDPDLFRMVHDTFQHCISGETELFPELTGMLHISGISDPDVTLDHQQDAHRIWVNADDRCGNITQIAALLDGGYRGGVSFECTAPHNFGADGPAKMQASFAYIEAALA